MEVLPSSQPNCSHSHIRQPIFSKCFVILVLPPNRNEQIIIQINVCSVLCRHEEIEQAKRLMATISPVPSEIYGSWNLRICECFVYATRRQSNLVNKTVAEQSEPQCAMHLSLRNSSRIYVVLSRLVVLCYLYMHVGVLEDSENLNMESSGEFCSVVAAAALCG